MMARQQDLFGEPAKPPKTWRRLYSCRLRDGTELAVVACADGVLVRSGTGRAFISREKLANVHAAIGAELDGVTDE